MVAVALMAGCRGHLAVCDDDSCASVAEPHGGAPSLAANAGGAAAGDAGASGAGASGAACASDFECDDGLRCDGEERCSDGGCEPGEPIVCSSGTSCDEVAPERCVYPERSPWLVLSAIDKLYGLPTALLGKVPLVELGARPRIDPWTGFDECSWSPDGSFLVVRAAEIQLGYSLSYARVDAGLPTPLRKLPELPSWYGVSGAQAFSPDARFFFASDLDTGGFLFDLRSPELTAQPLPAMDVEFCRGSGVWVSGDEVQSLGEGELSSRPLAAGSKQLSSDRELIVISRVDEAGDSIGFTLTPCSMDDWTANFLGDYALFSPDSRLLWIEDYAAGTAVYSLEEPTNPDQLLSSEVSGLEYKSVFSADGRYLLAERDDIYYLVEVRGGSEQPPISLNLPQDVEVIQLRNDGVLAWSTYELAEPRELLWQTIPPREAPLVLHLDTHGSDALLFDGPSPSQFFIATDDGSESKLLRIDLAAPEPTPEELISLEGSVVRWVPAPDGSGIALGVLTGTITQAAYFARFGSDGKLEAPILLAESGYAISFQPWP